MVSKSDHPRGPRRIQKRRNNQQIRPPLASALMMELRGPTTNTGSSPAQTHQSGERRQRSTSYPHATTEHFTRSRTVTPLHPNHGPVHSTLVYKDKKVAETTDDVPPPTPNSGSHQQASNRGNKLENVLSPPTVQLKAEKERRGNPSQTEHTSNHHCHSKTDLNVQETTSG